jgi:mannosyl-3-phosphoglycerate phosphatase
MSEIRAPGAVLSLLVATDLDASLLDEETYRWDAARPALRELSRRGATLVLCTSKTRAETAALVAELGQVPRPARVVENGGALVVPVDTLRREAPGARRDGDDWVLELGAPRRVLTACLDEIAAETGVPLRGFARLGVADIQRLTGLDEADARRAADREYDEPLQLGTEDPAALRLAEAAARRGLRLTRGGRFHHLTGATDKGRALRVLLGLHAAEGRRFTTVGLGDAPNDLPLLEAVEHPILIPRRAGVDPVLAKALPAAARAPEPGPSGWNAAVQALLVRLDRAAAECVPPGER